MSNESSEKASVAHRTFLDRLRAATPDIVKNNAPRVVAGLKILGCSSMLLSKNRIFSIAGAGFVTAFSMIAIFGGKKTQEQKEALRAQEEADAPEKPRGILSSYFFKIRHPKKYPIEAGTGVAMMSSAFWTASGLFGKGGFSWGRLVGGAFSLASDSNIVFTGEKIGDSETNPNKKGSPKYYMTELKRRPVLLSSLLNVTSDVASIAGGAYERFKGKESNTLYAGVFLLLANVFQAIFVNKNDYNIEGSSSEKKTTENVTPEGAASEKVATDLTKAPSKTVPEQAWSERVQKPVVANLSPAAGA